eukprot:06387.XXX_12196_12345_1 [CDS] Oithona nana genome sequencing.
MRLMLQSWPQIRIGIDQQWLRQRNWFTFHWCCHYCGSGIAHGCTYNTYW